MIERHEQQQTEAKVTYTSTKPAADVTEALTWLASVIQSTEIYEALNSNTPASFNFDVKLVSGINIFFSVVGSAIK